MAISKVVYNGNSLIDLTSDTVTADKLLEGYTAHGADGELVTGTQEEATGMTDAEILQAVVEGIGDYDV